MLPRQIWEDRVVTLPQWRLLIAGHPFHVPRPDNGACPYTWQANALLSCRLNFSTQGSSRMTALISINKNERLPLYIKNQ